MSLSNLTRHKAQAALEYLILLTVVAVVIFVAIKPSTSNRSILNKAQTATEGYYNTVTEVIMGKNPNPIDGGWCPVKPDGQCECACPAPAFGGNYCVNQGVCRASAGAPIRYCGDGVCTPGVETGESGHPRSITDSLITCFDDCPFVNDCNKCSTMVPSATCGIPCPITLCSASQVCMSSDCGNSCPGFQQMCQSNPLLCTASCRCNPGASTQVGGCGGIQGMCGPYPISPDEKCFRYTSCTGACSEFETFVARGAPECDHCANGALDTAQGETAIDCGGTCPSCCGNRRPDGTEQCDDGNFVNGDGCSTNCLLEANCLPTGVGSCTRAFAGSQYCCGAPTPGRNAPANQSCSIPQRCDPGETEANCPADCSLCVPNGNCVPADGTYQCGTPTLGVSQNCPMIPCTIPQQCDQGETCQGCPSDCLPGTCVPDSGVYQCGAVTNGQYSACPGVPCTIPRGCDSGETCLTCGADCGICACTGAIPSVGGVGGVICPGADQGITLPTPRKFVASCSGAKCEYSCPTGFTLETQRNNVQTCVCNSANCASLNCAPMSVPTECGGSVTLPQTDDGQDAYAACPTGCYGGILSFCSGGTFQSVNGVAYGAPGTTGWCKAAPACPPISFNNSTLSNTLEPIDCGTVSWGETPASTLAIAPCGANCDGYVTQWCDATGNWQMGWSQGGGGCRAKALLPCIAMRANTPCGAQIDIPALVAGQTYTTACPGGCNGGTISATCVDGSTNGGVPVISNNCHHCGDGVRDAGEMCDSDFVVCTSPSTGYQTCLPNCTGYGPCSDISCVAETLTIGTCGSITLPAVGNGLDSIANCPLGCTGTISARCSGTNFGAISGTCVADPCAAKDVTTSCGLVRLAGVPSGQTASISCPTGCPGGISATCFNGYFGTVTGSCSPDSCAGLTTISTACGNAALPAADNGQLSTAQCPSGCVGTITATCTNTRFSGPVVNCTRVTCPALLSTWGTGDCALNYNVSAGLVGATQNIPCGSTCVGTRTVTCTNAGTWSFADTCAPIYCTGSISANACGINVSVPQDGMPVQSGDIAYASCPTGCPGSGITSLCSVAGAFQAPTVNCTAGACADTIRTVPVCGTFTLPDALSGQQSSIPCPDGCSGGPLWANCTNGVLGATNGTCTPDDCLQETGNVPLCGPLTISPMSHGQTRNNISCPVGCTGTLSATCSMGGVTLIGTCTPGCPANSTWGSGACTATTSISQSPPSTNVDVGCGPSCDGTRSAVCSNGTWTIINDTCVVPTCSDGRQNGTETGLDCGGSCPACPVPCACDPNSAVAISNCGGFGPGLSCTGSGPSAGPQQRCFQYGTCAGSCTAEQQIVPLDDPTCP